MKKGGSNLFSYFKPASNGTPAKTPSKGSVLGNSGGRKKQKIAPSSRTQVNGSYAVKHIAMETEAVDEVETTPTSSGQKRPLPPDSDGSEGEIGIRRVSLHHS